MIYHIEIFIEYFILPTYFILFIAPNELSNVLSHNRIFYHKRQLRRSTQSQNGDLKTVLIFPQKKKKTLQVFFKYTETVRTMSTDLYKP